jgi:hypothetical protein
MDTKWALAVVVPAVCLFGVIVLWPRTPDGAKIAGGSISNGGWTRSSNTSCDPKNPFLFFQKDHLLVSDGTKTNPTVWMAFSGPNTDPTIRLSQSADEMTDSGWTLPAHINGDKITFDNLTAVGPTPPTPEEAAAVQRLVDHIRGSQPLLRCASVTPP